MQFQRDHGDECDCGCQTDRVADNPQQTAALVEMLRREGDSTLKPGVPPTTSNFGEPWWAI